ncbi:hypothetical protein VZT92_017624 [Zoarces viviparus]|uniref:Uncharacterized protein n=1 Tax=Zoarces viviparus TaxID=48416 RepID=A0AAW1EN07_ZOAVI
MVRSAWKPTSKGKHINVLKLRLIYLSLVGPIIFLIGIDYSSTLYHVNKQRGTRSLSCFQVARKLLLWAFPIRWAPVQENGGFIWRL